MPQLDLYNFYLIIIFAITGIILFFIYFQKYWLYSWKILTFITLKIKNITTNSNSLVFKIFVVLSYGFLFFNHLICFFFHRSYLTLFLQKTISLDFTTINELNQIKTYI